MQSIQSSATAEQPIADELTTRLSLIADQANQGEDYHLESNVTLYILGLVLPLILMFAGWHW